jgi:uncharacterized surface protein with fasciclin (FAS1) repeats
MKKIILTAIGFTIIMLGQISCKKTEAGDVSFKELDKYSIYSYMVAHKDTFSSFLRIVDEGGIQEVLSSYNTTKNSLGYTLFLPDNNAVDKFIRESGKYASLEELLKDKAYVSELCRFHVLSASHKTDDFPYGFFMEQTISDDQLGVNIPKDSARFFINNQAPVVRSNIKVSNGYIHIIGGLLKPIVYTSYNWLEQNAGFSIFKKAVDITGLKSKLDFNRKSSINGSLFTLLLEPDSVYAKHKIYSLTDLENFISPNNTDYTSPSNPLNKFVLYHLLEGSLGLNDFVKKNNVSERNYDTYSDIPLRITDLGLFCVINRGSTIFDTIVHGKDITIINYIGFNYDASNILTQSGAINVIDQVLMQVEPKKTKVDLQFYDKEPLLQKIGNVQGQHLIEDSTALKTLKWTGPDMYYVSGDWGSQAWNGNYLMINKGDFTLTYTTPKIIPGNYSVLLRANCKNADNAFIQMYIDGISIGGVIDLTTGALNWDAFNPKNLGSINFSSYEQHVIVIKSLIPGKFLLDVISFDPLVQ